MKIAYFERQAAFRAWLEENHGSVTELWVGFYKKASRKPSITYPEALDEALCFGWIDGVRKSVDAECYVQRFTPRKAKSNWSLVNIRRVKALVRKGQVHAAGLKAFAARDEKRAAKYSYERKTARLQAAMLKEFRGHAKAWGYFHQQAPSYQRVTVWWVISAKQKETRERRLTRLIADSAARRRVGPFVSPKGKRK